MLKPRIIAFDLDDTLLKDDLSISDYTVRTLKKAVAEGIYIVLASGRADNAILPTVRRLDIAGTEQGRYIIGLNGASITDLHLRTIIYHQFLPQEIALRAFDVLNDKEINPDEGLNCHVYDGNTIYVPRVTAGAEQDAALSGLHVEVVADFRAFLMLKERPKLVFSGSPATVERMQPLIKKELGGKAVVFTSKPYFLEIMPANCGKGIALAVLAEKLGIPHGQTMAFGDSMNDESMILGAGIGVAMKNGLQSIRSIAQYVTEKTNDEDGAAFFIEKHCLNHSQ